DSRGKTSGIHTILLADLPCSFEKKRVCRADSAIIVRRHHDCAIVNACLKRTQILEVMDVHDIRPLSSQHMADLDPCRRIVSEAGQADFRNGRTRFPEARTALTVEHVTFDTSRLQHGKKR